ncbi:MAG TPA: hypothetical protein VFX59_00455 [Polyangiales bacterium]|nr:hypothetical protein [Polyangiales bacterium]
MPTHAPRPTVCIRWFLATCLGACVGTPTPEPPDNLPRPDDWKIFGGSVPLATTTDVRELVSPIPFAGSVGSVAPNSELWVVNLDRAEVSPLTVIADAQGGFTGMLSAQLNDRVRLVSRTDSQHSLPLDAYVITGMNNQAQLAQLPSTELSCLRVTPAEELTAVVGNDVTRRFTLTSTCSEPISLDARLRFGDAGFAIDAPTSLPANGRAEITVRITGHDDPREHADILLLDVESGANRGRYALGVWSVAASRLDD